MEMNKVADKVAEMMAENFVFFLAGMLLHMVADKVDGIMANMAAEHKKLFLADILLHMVARNLAEMVSDKEQ